MQKLLAGVAAMAMAFGTAHAQPSGNPGKGNDKQQSAKQADKPDKARKSVQASGGGKDAKTQRANVERAPDRAQSNRGNANSGKANGAAGRGNDKVTPGDLRRADYRDDRGPDRQYRGKRDGDFGYFVDRIARIPYSTNRGLIDGCPPGLAKKSPRCVPPGIAKKDTYGRNTYYRPSFFGIRGIGDGRYYYDDGFLYRMGDGGLISSFLPLLGGALGIGNAWPSYYQPAPLDPYYVDYYSLGRQRDYRYANNVIYRVDPETTAITSIAALLTGDDFQIGQPMPLGYDVYNVPYGYRDRYYDRPDAYYRYSDGYIYEVDPETRLIAAAIELAI